VTRKNKKRRIRAYLAGPDVFFPDARARGEEKKRILAGYGIDARFPLDNAIEEKDPKRRARKIGKANEKIMLWCGEKGHFGFIFADMRAWDGPSMDVGTAFEMGFMSAMAAFRPGQIMIIGYGADGDLAQRMKSMDIRGARKAKRRKGGCLIAPDGTTIEDFGLADNLMLMNAIEKTGGKLCAGFADAAAFAAAALKKFRL